MNPEKTSKILIVEDQPDNLLVIAKILSSSELSLEIIKATNGKVALQLIDYSIPDLVITDWKMPEIDGFELIKQLKQNEQTKDIPVIMCTGVMTSSGNLSVALKAGAVDYIRKPIDKVELLARVSSMLQLAESQNKVRHQKEVIEKEKLKTEKLLLNILPKSIVAELKDKGEAQPTLYKDVSVFFSDFVGFTKLCLKLTPQELIHELNEIFTVFDRIMDHNNCERIKTIGDAYMAVCGMPIANKNHAINLVKASVEILEYLKERNKNNSLQWNIRIGINSGEVIGGIVGTTKYAYDVFGDTINKASRMESYSEPNKINISENTATLVQQSFKLIKRPPVIIKNYGNTNMFFIDTSMLY